MKKGLIILTILFLITVLSLIAGCKPCYYHGVKYEDGDTYEWCSDSLTCRLDKCNDGTWIIFNSEDCSKIPGGLGSCASGASGVGCKCVSSPNKCSYDGVNYEPGPSTADCTDSSTCRQWYCNGDTGQWVKSTYSCKGCSNPEGNTYCTCTAGSTVEVIPTVTPSVIV